MKTNFFPVFYRESGGSSGGGNTPWGAILGTGAGLVQSIVGGIKANKAQKGLEKLQTPTYTKSQSILDYYSKALQRYNVDPYSSIQYKKAVQDTGRSTAQGLEALRGRGGAVAGVNSLIANQNDNLLSAATIAEQQKNQRFNELAGATGMKAGEEMKDFQYNKVAPFEKKYNLLALKAGGANQTANAGLSNLFGGLQGLSNISMLNKLYGGDNSAENTGGLSNPTETVGIDYLLKNRKILRPRK